MNPEYYNNLLRTIESEECILVIGPELFLLGNKDETLIQNLRDFIYTDREKLRDKPYIYEDGFFYVDKRSEERRTILFDLQDFYSDQNERVPDFYYKLAALPFKVVINLSPDDLFSKALRSINRTHKYIYYKQSNHSSNSLYLREYDEELGDYVNTQMHNDNTLQKASFNCPWVINLLGIYSDTESLVFTFDALFDFMHSIFPISSLPQSLRNEIEKSTSFLFLGFDYNKWFLKIIFFILHKISDNAGTTIKKAILNFTDNQKGSIKFYEDQFKVSFLKMDTLEFIKRIYNDSKKRWRPKGAEAKIKADHLERKEIKILYLSSQPNDKIHLRSDREYLIIEGALMPNENRALFELNKQFAVTQQKMLRLIDSYHPDIVIFSMHGSSEDGLLFEDKDGEAEPLTLDNFLQDIRALSSDPLFKTQLILFSCCHSAKFAEAVIDIIPNSVGVEGLIHEDAMYEFCRGFFESYFTNPEIEDSFRLGRRFVERREDLQEYSSKINYFNSSLALKY